MASPTAYVEPTLLKWARRTANLEVLAAAHKIKVPEDRIVEWESGESLPTIAELRRAADVYRRPLGVFFLPEPPKDFETLRDFRRLDPGQSAEWSVALHAEYRRAHAQRNALLEIAELDGVVPDANWLPGKLPDRDNSIAEIGRTILCTDAPREFPRATANEYAFLGYWTSALEHAGVLVMSTAGGQVSPEEMRAFSLYFDTIPVIVLNGADWPRGRLFSLLHEYAHLLLHTPGLCDTHTDVAATTENRQIEARCNGLAALMLMPSRDLQSLPLVLEHDPDEAWSLADLIQGARPFGVSAESFLRRLVTLGHATFAEYQEFRQAQKQSDRAKDRSQGGSFYLNKARDLGKGYVRTVSDAHRRALIDSTTAATYLDVKVDQIPKLAERARL